MSKATPVTGFGGFDPKKLGSTKPVAITYDPAGGHPIDRQHPQSTYSGPEMKPARGDTLDERVSFELDLRR
jgi:hypothetical protein